MLMRAPPLPARHPEVHSCSGNRDQARTDALSALASSSCALHGFLCLPAFPSRTCRAKVASIASLKRSVPKTRHRLRVTRISCNRPTSIGIRALVHADITSADALDGWLATSNTPHKVLVEIMISKQSGPTHEASGTSATLSACRHLTTGLACFSASARNAFQSASCLFRYACTSSRCDR